MGRDGTTYVGNLREESPEEINERLNDQTERELREERAALERSSDDDDSDRR